MKLGLLAWPVLLAASSALPLGQDPRPPLDPTPVATPPVQDRDPEPDQLTQAELEALSRSIQGQIEEMRGQTFPRAVKVELTDVEGFLRYARKRLDELQTPEDIAREETVAKLLGMVPPEMDLLQVTLDVLEEQVGGFYDPKEETFYLMSRFTGGIAKIILAHELAHALDDQLYDIDGHLERLENNADATLAFHAVVEGSGTAAMLAWTKSNIGELSLEDLTDAPSLESPSLAVAPEYVWKPMLAAYLHGAAFLVKSEAIFKGQTRTPENADIHQAFNEPPRSTEQILHPEKYWSFDKRDDPRTIAFASDDLAEGWIAADEDTLGELGLALATRPLKKRSGLDASNPFAAVKARYTHRAAEGWGGDRFLLLSNGDAHVLRLVTVWDTTEDAVEFTDALRDLAEHIEGNAQAVARRAGLDDHGGLRIEGDGDEVLVTIWSGVDEERAHEVVATVRHWEGAGHTDVAEPFASER